MKDRINNFINNKTNVIAAALLLLFFLLALFSMIQKSPVVDESAHLPAGYSYLKTFDYRMNPEHPPLIKVIAAFPLLFLDPKIELEGELWDGDFEWGFGKEFLLEDNDTDRILFWARLPMILLGVLLGFFIFLWAKELYGRKAGLFALLLYSFSPTFLAHTRWANTDVGGTCFIVIALFFLWKYFERPGTKALIIAGITLGLAQLAKFSSFYLFPLYLILVFIFLFYNKIKDKKRIVKSFLNVILIFFIGYLVIVIGYPGDPLLDDNSKINFVKEMLPGKNPYVEGTAYYSIKYLPMPKTYLVGLVKVMQHSKTGHPSFLMGEFSQKGRLEYFPIVFLVKTPVPTIILILLSLLFFSRIRHKKLFNEIYLAVPALFFFLAFMMSNLNIGHRHIVPVYPFIFIFVSKIVNLDFKQIIKNNLFSLSIIILVIWYVFSSLLIFPHYLTYFNEIAGGPGNGYRILSDSNIDWGQDLKGLDAYMKKNNIKNITLSYWGIDIPENRGMEYVKYRKIIKDRASGVCEPGYGLLAVSVNHLVGTLEFESRCFDWLNDYKPIKKIGHSIFIYNVTG